MTKAATLAAASLSLGALAGVGAALGGPEAGALGRGAWVDPQPPAAVAADVGAALLAAGHLKAPEAAAAAPETAPADVRPGRPRAVAVLFVNGAARVVLLPEDGKVVTASVGDAVDGWRIADASPDSARVAFERDGEREVVDVISGTAQ